MVIFEELTINEKEACKELKKRISHEIPPDLKSDSSLYLRFLRARDFNVDAAENMLRNHMAWRVAIQMDSIFTNFVQDEVAVKHFPIARVGFDHEGSLVRYLGYGNFDSRGLLKACKKNICIKTLVAEFEKDILLLKEQSEKLGKPVQQWIYIFDYENFSFANATHKPTIEAVLELFHVYEANYPERLKRAFLINTSPYFALIYQVVKPLLTGNTLKKISIYGKDGYQEELLKIMDAADLPAFLGGQRTDPDGNPRCCQTINHGGLIPRNFYMTRSIQRLKGKPDVKKFVISRMSKERLTFDVKEAGSNIEWEFETESRDIGFGLSYQDPCQKCATTVDLIPKQRIDTNFSAEVGTFLCTKPGRYILTFDNSYSWIFQKELYFKVQVVSPTKKKASVEY